MHCTDSDYPTHPLTYCTSTVQMSFSRNVLHCTYHARAGCPTCTVNNSDFKLALVKKKKTSIRASTVVALIPRHSEDEEFCRSDFDILEGLGVWCYSTVDCWV